MKIGDLRCRPQQFLVEDSHCINPILVCSKLKWRNPEKYLITQRWETCCGKRKNIVKYFVLKIYKKFFNPDLTYLFQNMLLQCQSELVCTVTNIAFHSSWLRQPPSLPCRVCPTAVHQNHFSQDLWQKIISAACTKVACKVLSPTSVIRSEYLCDVVAHWERILRVDIPRILTTFKQ